MLLQNYPGLVCTKGWPKADDFPPCATDNAAQGVRHIMLVSDTSVYNLENLLRSESGFIMLKMLNHRFESINKSQIVYSL